MNLPKPSLNQIKSTDIDTELPVKGAALASSITVTDNCQIERLSPLALAYIGDAVYELYVRTYLLLPPKRIADYHTKVVTQVRAEAQAAHLKDLEPYLTLAEKDIVRRGRNAVTSKPRRLSIQIYQQATSLEALIGYLHLTDPHRLQELLIKLDLSENFNERCQTSSDQTEDS